MRLWHRGVPFKKVHADVKIQGPIRLGRHHSCIHPQVIVPLIQDAKIPLGLSGDIFHRAIGQRGFIAECEPILNPQRFVNPMPLVAIAAERE